VDFAFSEEQEMLRGAARSWLSSTFPPQRVAELADSQDGWDPASWSQLRRLGWLDDDLGMLELAVLAEEGGYALLPAPWWSTVALTAGVLGRVPQAPTTLAWAEPGRSDLRAAGLASATAATDADGGWQLSGTKVRVPDLAAAESVLVTAEAPGGVGIWRVAVAEGVATPRATVDLTRRLSDLVLVDAPAELVISPGGAGAALAGVRRRAVGLLACEAVGIMQRTLELATEHAQQRTQFGRPIGSYQAVSHPIADLYTALALARSLAYRAAWTVDTDAPEVDEALALAALAAGDGAVRACETAIQVLGGVGFTWDHVLHRYYKRAQWIAAFDGTTQSRRAELAAVLLD